MTVTIDSDLQRDIEEKLEPCMCAQMAEGWVDFYEGRHTRQIRENLKQAANPQCFMCKGEGVETVEHEINVPQMHLSNRNAMILFEVLGLPIETENGFVGEISVSRARQAVLRATNRGNLNQFLVPERQEFGKPREIEPGVVDLKPLRFYDPGMSEEKLQRLIKQFADLVIEVSRRGGTKIVWS